MTMEENTVNTGACDAGEPVKDKKPKREREAE
jgi:hypothetical protein